MKIQTKSPIKHFGYFRIILPIFLAVFIGVVGCATQEPNPLAGWHFSSLDNLHSNKAIMDDFQDYIQKLPPKERNYVGSVFYFEDGTGQHAIDVEIFVKGQNASWHYAIIYDKENKRVKAIKYGYSRYQS
ncbi:MAG TPA: hypothetical protein VHY30_02105 [Verrucomicrobiae bacterium]|jgi:hypothetical protein|nr:hypothetical protein [Verrucomicrobiae bacterium]